MTHLHPHVPWALPQDQGFGLCPHSGPLPAYSAASLCCVTWDQTFGLSVPGSLLSEASGQSTRLEGRWSGEEEPGLASTGHTADRPRSSAWGQGSPALTASVSSSVAGGKTSHAITRLRGGWTRGHPVLGGSISEPRPSLLLCPSSVCTPFPARAAPALPGFPGRPFPEGAGGPRAPSPAWVVHPRRDPWQGGLQASLSPCKLPWKPPSNHANRLCAHLCSSTAWLSLGKSRVTSGAEGQAEDREPWSHFK